MRNKKEKVGATEDDAAGARRHPADEEGCASKSQRKWTEFVHLVRCV